jgi:osmotically-inducible protein OsmY
MSLEEQQRYLTEDPDVEQDVRDELGILGFARRGFIGLAVDHGVVELTGFTDSYAQKWEIERAASRVIGVRDVRDYLEVRPPGAAQRADSRIASAARCLLEWNARVPATVEVEVTDGELRLRGIVELLSQREAAEEAVRNLVGVRDVSNEIKIAPIAPPADVAGDVESAMRRRFGLLCRHVWMVERDGLVTVSGTVGTFELVGDVERVAKSVPGVVRVDNRLLVA